MYTPKTRSWRGGAFSYERGNHVHPKQQVLRGAGRYPMIEVTLYTPNTRSTFWHIQEQSEPLSWTTSYVPPPSTLHPPPSTIHPPPFTLHHPPCILHPPPCILHPASSTLHPPPSTLHPLPSTLYPPPYSPLSAPYTLHSGRVDQGLGFRVGLTRSATASSRSSSQWRGIHAAVLRTCASIYLSTRFRVSG